MLMRLSKSRRILGGILLVVSVVGLVFATINLLTLPSIERRIVETIPSAEATIKDAAAQSRRKSFIAIAACTATLLGGVALFCYGRESRAK